MASTSTSEPRRGDVWLTSFGAGRRGEPTRNRPAVVVSADSVLAGLLDEPIVVVPLSSSLRASPLRPEMHAGEDGVEQASRAVCGAVRGLARSRLLRRLGALTPASLAEVDRALALMLALDR